MEIKSIHATARRKRTISIEKTMEEIGKPYFSLCIFIWIAERNRFFLSNHRVDVAREQLVRIQYPILTPKENK
jgi:hypothetical protein